MLTPLALSKEIKKDMTQVLSRDFVWSLFDKRLKVHYPDFIRLQDLQIEPYKKHIGASSAVFVVAYHLKYQAKDASVKKLEIFVSAHSDSSRARAYEYNQCLYQHGFNRGRLRVTRPLFYLEKQRAYFYQASPGRPLFSFFAHNPEADLQPVFRLVAAWLKKLHQLSYGKIDCSWPSFTIDQMVPEPEHFLADFVRQDQELGSIASRLYQQMLKIEKSNEADLAKCLIYGDNHPENVIIESLEADHLEMIDFTDVALGDAMVDLGTFVQQFDFMGHNFISRSRMNYYKTFFVESYFGRSFARVSPDCLRRLNLYQAWTALRTATFLFYMKDSGHTIINLLRESEAYLQLALVGARQINLSK